MHVCSPVSTGSHEIHVIHLACSMCRYAYPRTHTCAGVSHLMEGSARLNLSKHHRAEDLFEALFELYMGGSC